MGLAGVKKTETFGVSCIKSREEALGNDVGIEGEQNGLSEENMNKLQRVQTVQPTIIKPKPMWTGKQVITTVLKNIVISGMTKKQIQHQNKICGMNMDGKAKLSQKDWGPLGKEEGEVIIRDNEHL